MIEREWTSQSPEPGATLEADGIVVRCGQQDGATLISGDFAAALSEFAPDAPVLGLLEPQPEPPFALRAARDRILLCTEKSLEIDGWKNSYAASAADDLYLVITVTGNRASEVQASCMTAAKGSPSATTFFAGFGAFVSGLPDGFVLRVQRPDAAAVWAHLDLTLQSL